MESVDGPRGIVSEAADLWSRRRARHFSLIDDLCVTGRDVSEGAGFTASGCCGSAVINAMLATAVAWRTLCVEPSISA